MTSLLPVLMRRKAPLPAADAVIDWCTVTELLQRNTLNPKEVTFCCPACAVVPTSGMRALPSPAIASLVSCVLLLLLQGLQGRVVEEFSHVDSCKDSLYMGTPPRGFFSGALRKICQRYGNKPYYVTLYDPRKHIPIYSGYTFKKSDGEIKVDVPWMFEPQVSVYKLLLGANDILNSLKSSFVSWQNRIFMAKPNEKAILYYYISLLRPQQLASEKTSSNMVPFLTTHSLYMNFEDTQAVLEDYANMVHYQRGQLNPAAHQANQLEKTATYTLTNVVPLYKEFKSGPWAKYLDLIRRRLNNYCQGKAYVVTGVTTSGRTIQRNNVDRIAVPEYMWSAYCCTEFDQNAPYFVRYKFPTFAAHGLNDRISNDMVEVSLQNLEKFIKERMEVDNLQLFYDNCMSES